jgi:hypothetical protein
MLIKNSNDTIGHRTRDQAIIRLYEKVLTYRMLEKKGIVET